MWKSKLRLHIWHLWSGILLACLGLQRKRERMNEWMKHSLIKICKHFYCSERSLKNLVFDRTVGFGRTSKWEVSLITTKIQPWHQQRRGYFGVGGSIIIFFDQKPQNHRGPLCSSKKRPNFSQIHRAQQIWMTIL